MKTLIVRLGYGFVVLFVAGILATTYYLYDLPQRFLTTGLLDLEAVEGIQPVLTQLNLVVLGLSFIGLTTVMLILMAKSGSSENVVYVDRFKDQKDNETEDAERKLDGSKYEELIKEVKALITQKEDDKKVLNKVLSKVCKDLEASQGAIYKAGYEEKRRFIELFATFAYSIPDSQQVQFEFGEGLAGQAAKTGKMVNLKNVPEGYIKILSGLGSASPTRLIIVPIVENEKTYGVMEIASFTDFNKEEEDFLKAVASILAKRLASEKEAVTEAEEK